MTATRLDQFLVNRGLVASRERAGALIKKGAVRVNGQVVDRPGKKFDGEPSIDLLEQPMPWVSRGALKLIAALDGFGIRPEGRTALDVGASTGGFTEVLLDRGARRVYALDAGTDQLAERLQKHPDVVSIEQQNIRTAPDALLPEKVNLVVIDVSFIRLALVLPEVLRFVERPFDLIALVKPQFEVGQAGLNKHGVVRSEALRKRALQTVLDAAKALHYTHAGTLPSPIEGGDGNHEYLIHLK